MLRVIVLISLFFSCNPPLRPECYMDLNKCEIYVSDGFIINAIEIGENYKLESKKGANFVNICRPDTNVFYSTSKNMFSLENGSDYLIWVSVLNKQTNKGFKHKIKILNYSSDSLHLIKGELLRL